MKKFLRKIKTTIALILVVAMAGTFVPAIPAAAATVNVPEMETASFFADLLIQIITVILDFFRSIFNASGGNGTGNELPATPVLVEKILVDNASLKMVAGDCEKINVTVTPDDAADKNVVFASADETVAAVDAEGNVTAVAAGTTTITVTATDAGAASAVVAVNVYNGSITNYEEFKSYKTFSGTYKLDEDVNADDALFFGSGTDVLLDMNGKTVNALKKTQYIFCAQTSDTLGAGSLYITGDGVVNAGLLCYANKAGSVITIDNGTYISDAVKVLDKRNVNSVAQKESKIVINGGSFISTVDDSVLFYVIYGASVEVNGGFFENKADKTPELMIAARNPDYNNRIFLKGGTFVNWSPADAPNFYDGAMEDLPFGPYIILCEGYTIVSETQENGDIWYSVVPVAE